MADCDRAGSGRRYQWLLLSRRGRKVPDWRRRNAELGWNRAITAHYHHQRALLDCPLPNNERSMGRMGCGWWRAIILYAQPRAKRLEPASHWHQLAALHRFL